MNILYFTSIVTGVIFGIGAIGLGLIYKYLKFPDFTTIISLTIGSAVMAVVSPTSIILAIFLSIIAGAFLGFLTFCQIRFLDVSEILAGIITSVGAVSIVYIITDSNAIVNSSDTVKVIYNNILSSKFSWWNILKIGIVGLTISFLVSTVFNTRYGLHILGMFGNKNYLEHRHRHKNHAKIFLLVIGNGIISFAGAILTIQNGNFNISGTPDFLVTALSGYVLATFLIHIFSGQSSFYHFQKESKPSGKFYYKIIHALQRSLNKNDEEQIKIFWFLNFIIFGTVIVNLIFQYIDANYSDDSRVSYLYKAAIFLLVIAAGKFEKLITKK